LKEMPVPKTRRHSLPAGELWRGRGSRAGSPRRPPGPMCSAVAVCHASGSALMNRSAGRSVWPKKNQWYQLAVNLASHRASASPMGMASIRHRRRTEPGWYGQPLGDVRTATMPGDIESAVPVGAHQGNAIIGHKRAWSRVDGRVSSAASTIRRIRAGQDSCKTCPTRPRRSASPSQARTPSASRPTMRTP
jgi:hypothetical protein